mmetsp:Transcript_46598/g.108622  ORF Transcript_46598/g.108622 Transcript_46598/m.108622 type:complete len:216 (-) Transcript_46598:87-734(-)
MCKQGTCPVIGQIAVASLLIITILLATIGVWFRHEFDGGSGGCSFIYRVYISHGETEYNCDWLEGTSSTSWEDACEYNDEAAVCGMWRPSQTLHIISLVLVICALSTASAHACACCCEGTKTNLQCSMGFTISAFVQLLVGFIMFSTVRGDIEPGLDVEFDFSWGWGLSLLSLLLLIANIVLSCISTAQDVPKQEAVVAPIVATAVVVGMPVEGN